MHLVYLDESGNTGMNLGDPDQPIFLLCAMVVAENKWHNLENDLQAILDRILPQWRETDGFEIHGADLRTGRGAFLQMPVSGRIAFRDEWMNAGIKNGVRIIVQTIRKNAFADWLRKTFGEGVVIHPYVAAFALLSRCVDGYLKSLPGGPELGMFIADENHEIVSDIEKSISILRETAGPLRLGQIVERCFFIESSKSLPLQLCDLFALSVRKGEELAWRKPKTPAKSFDLSGIKLAETIRHKNEEHFSSVLEWLKHRGKSAKK